MDALLWFIRYAVKQLHCGDTSTSRPPGPQTGLGLDGAPKTALNKGTPKGQRVSEN
uniref:Uncharacterized protein n=1 Tax=Anguilla anguilla TaxID=7936 RepID=A0A0E9XNC5_ANGAN